MPEIIYPELSYQVQGALFDVYNALRYHRLSENGWESALLIALADRGVSARQQAEYEARYKGYRIGRFFVDVVAEEQILLELKVADQLLPIDIAQTLTYMKVTGLKLGILANFGQDRLETKRIPNFIREQVGGAPVGTTKQAAGDLLYEELTRDLRDALYEVHGTLGPGLMPMHYRRATQIELRLRGIPYQVQREITVQFRGRPIETHDVRLLIIDGKVLVWPLTVGAITPILLGCLRQYIGLLNLRLGLLVNYHAPSLDIKTTRI